MSRLAIVALTLLTCSCTWTYERRGATLPTDADLESAFVAGSSTASDVLEVLGPPHVIRRQFDGHLYSWRYSELEQRSLEIFPWLLSLLYYENGRVRGDDLAILFDEEGVMQAFGVRRELVDEDDD